MQGLISKPPPHKHFLVRSSSLNLYSDPEYFLIRFPKYPKSLHLPKKVLQSHKFSTKLKHLKMIKLIGFSGLEKVPPLLILSAFQSQRKVLSSIKGSSPEILAYFPKVVNYSLDVLNSQSWRIFSHLRELRKITLALPYKISIQKEFASFIMSKRMFWPRNRHLEKRTNIIEQLESEFWTHWLKSMEKTLWYRRFQHLLYIIGRLRKKEVLKIKAESFNSRLLSILIDKMNRNPQFLGSLKSLSVSVNLSNSKEVSQKDFFFPIFLNYVSKLKISDSVLPASHYLLEHAACFANNLVHLEIDKLKYENLDNFLEGKNVQLNFEVLNWLRTFRKLKTLIMTLVLGTKEHLIKFLELFSLPENIVLVKLALQDVSWSGIIEPKEMGTDNPFELEGLFTDFFGRWQKLDRLESLSLIFQGLDQQEIPSMYFLISLLRRIPSLATLHYSNHLMGPNPRKNSFDFGYFWEGIRHFRNNLRSIKIDDVNIDLANFQRGQSQEELVRFEDFGLFGAITGSGRLLDLFKVFGKAKKSENMRVMVIKTLLIEDGENLRMFLQALLKKPKGLYLDVYIDIRDFDPSILIDQLEEFSRYAKSETFTSLYIENSKGIEYADLERLGEIINRNPMFISLSITTMNHHTIFYL